MDINVLRGLERKRASSLRGMLLYSWAPAGFLAGRTANRDTIVPTFFPSHVDNRPTDVEKLAASSLNFTVMR